jgi:YVTN family beta-propeller protein
MPKGGPVNVRRDGGPYNRSTLSHNRAACPVAVLLAVCCCLSAAHSQWLEKTIYLPDSFGRFTSLTGFVYHSTNNTLYVAGNSDGNCVLAIDGATNQKIARIPTVSAGSALCTNPTENKIYCANYSSNNVTVISGATNSVIATVTTCSHPRALCHNPTENKVYCANNGDSSVTVIDGANDSAIATVATGTNPRALCYNPTYKKVYTANYLGSNLTVIDGATDSVVATVAVGSYPYAL